MTGDSLPLAVVRSHLKADCSRCAALCCVAPAFSRSADFAVDKPAGVPCPKLEDDRCTIHSRLRESGFPGCAAFDCFGAGQHVTQVVFDGRHWRDEPALSRQMFAVLPVVRQLHEVLFHVAEALSLVPSGALREDLQRAQASAEALRVAGPVELATVDAGVLRRQVGPLLEQVSAAVRAQVQDRRDCRGADLVGADLAGADLRGADLRGAYLIGADLRGADLDRADLLGADLRAADVRGAALAGALFLTQPLLEAAVGDASTTVPGALTRPVAWAAHPARRRRR